MGILKKVIGELLATNPHVEKYYPATPAEGGTGATVVDGGEGAAQGAGCVRGKAHPWIS
jgi:DNA-nicking Smr family endonuclease